jgi:hypothetical protein
MRGGTAWRALILTLLLLAGWYALAPPEAQVNGETRYFPTAPLYRWQQVRAFDSAADCQAWLVSESEDARADLRRWNDASREGVMMREVAADRLGWLSVSRCVASDDYRLLRRP